MVHIGYNFVHVVVECSLFKVHFTIGTMHLLPNQDFGFSNPLSFVITFSTERNQKLTFSDPPLLTPHFVIL